MENIKPLLKPEDLCTTSTKKWETAKFRLKYLTLGPSNFLDILDTIVDQDQRNVNSRLTKADVINNYENYRKEVADFCWVYGYFCLSVFFITILQGGVANVGSKLLLPRVTILIEKAENTIPSRLILSYANFSITKKSTVIVLGILYKIFYKIR